MKTTYTLVHVKTGQPVKIGDPVAIKGIRFDVYQINPRNEMPGSGYIDLVPDEGGHPTCRRPEDFGMEWVQS